MSENRVPQNYMVYHHMFPFLKRPLHRAHIWHFFGGEILTNVQVTTPIPCVAWAATGAPVDYHVALFQCALRDVSFDVSSNWCPQPRWVFDHQKL